MEVCAAPSFPSSLDTVSATCLIVVSYDWSSTLVQMLDYYPYGATRISASVASRREQPQAVPFFHNAELLFAVFYLNWSNRNAQHYNYVVKDQGDTSDILL